MKQTAMMKALITALVVVLIPALAWSQGKPDASAKKTDDVLNAPGRLFDIKPPAAFKALPVEEPGVMKWTAGSAEIFLAVGEVFQESGKVLLEALEKAASTDERIESVQKVDIKYGKAILLKEKAPESPTRLKTWRLVVVAGDRMINIDFSAPARDFDAFSKDFEACLKSFHLRSAS